VGSQVKFERVGQDLGWPPVGCSKDCVFNDLLLVHYIFIVRTRSTKNMALYIFIVIKLLFFYKSSS